MRWLALACAIGLLVFSVRPVWGAPRLRALLANPAGSDNTEWILLENDSSSSWSGQISVKDTAGSSITYSTNINLFGNELRELPRSLTNISLNNDQDSIVLSLNGTASESSDLYTNMLDDEVWWRDDSDVWRKESLNDFVTRKNERKWSVNSAVVLDSTTIDPQPTPITVAVATPVPQNDVEMVAEEALELTILQPLTLPRIGSVKAASYSAIIDERLPLPPVPDTEEELAKFYSWRKGAFSGASLLLWGGGVVCFVAWRMAQNAYNEETWIAPLPSTSARSPPLPP